MTVFSPEDRARVRERVLEVARADPRVSGGAITGSVAVGAEDRWSDVDTSFGVADSVDPEAVLEEWTEVLTPELGVLHHWDLRSGATIYRVYLLRGGLELNIAVTPAAEFGARGPRFQLVFGEGAELPPVDPPRVDELVGYGWLYAINTRTAIERAKPWQAEYFISCLRNHALALACVRLGQPAVYGRGFDLLPSDVTGPYEEALVRSLEPDELRRALAVAAAEFLREVERFDPGLARRLKEPLGELTAP